MTEPATPNDRPRALLGLPYVLLVLAAVTVAGIYLGLRFGLGLFSLATLAIPVAGAILYLPAYRRLPARPAPPTPEKGPTASETTAEAEPFVDPVEEADRLDREAAVRAEDAAPDPASAPDVKDDGTEGD